MSLLNNTKYFSYIDNKLEKYKKEYDENKEVIRQHQYVFEKIFFDDNLYNLRKGMLAMHLPGSGKSILSINVAFKFLELNPKKKVIFLANKSLHANYLVDIKKYINLYKRKFKEDLSEYIKDIEFITLNSGAVRDVITINKIDGNLLIIDEAHNLFNAIHGNSEIGLYLYNIICNAKKVKIIFLTGTPIINTFYESLYCFNMLSNKILFPDIKKNNFIIPDNFDKEELLRRFNKIGNRFFGLVSFHKTPKSYSQYFPKDLGINIIKCEFTKMQTKEYEKAKEYEERVLLLPKITRKDIVNNVLERKLSGGSFYIYSRLACIRAIKENVLECIKYKKILNTIKKINRNAIIYSNFVNEFGLNGISEFLKKYDYECVNEITNIKYLNNIFREKKKRFAIFSGEVPSDFRAEIQKAYNNIKNKHGEYLQILLLSRTGAEGLDLKCIRSIHILEPHFNMSRIIQIKYRGIRYKSHEILPKNEREVITYIYLSSLGKVDYTVDEYIWDSANLKENINNKFINIMQTYAIDCELNEEIKCTDCLANTNIKLYDENYITDLHMTNPCETKKNLKIDYSLLGKTKEKDIYISNITNKKYKIINDNMII